MSYVLDSFTSESGLKLGTLSNVLVATGDKDATSILAIMFLDF